MSSQRWVKGMLRYVKKISLTFLIKFTRYQLKKCADTHADIDVMMKNVIFFIIHDRLKFMAIEAVCFSSVLVFINFFIF
jgi:hypothetical protein